jgi:hypothetical protein
MEFKYTNIGDVRDPLIPLVTEGCKFWQQVVTDLNIRVCVCVCDGDGNEGDEQVQFPSDDVLEQFYEQYFPDDIPDEWSKQDQEKSHGRGLLAKPKSQGPQPPPAELSVFSLKNENENENEFVDDIEWAIGICVRDV